MAAMLAVGDGSDGSNARGCVKAASSSGFFGRGQLLRVFARSATVSVPAWNAGGLLTQPIGRTKGKAMSCSSSPQVGNAMPSSLMPLSAKPNRQKPSAKSTFDEWTGPWCESACLIFCRVHSNVQPNCMALLGANFIVSTLMPQKEQSTVSRVHHLRWGMMPKGDTHKPGRSLTKRQGNRVKKPLLTKSNISSRGKGLCSLQD